MSDLIATLRALLAGDAVDRRWFLPTCTAEAYAAEAFGDSAIRELFARNPAPLSDAPHLILSDRYAAVFDADSSGREQALIVETYDGRIARLWRLGEGAADATAEPRLRVATDPFLSQWRQSVAFEARDFPWLDPQAGPAVMHALAESIDPSAEPAGALDRRAIALRAFSAGPLSAVFAQVLGPRMEPVGLAIALRLEGGACVHRWCVTDGQRALRTVNDLKSETA